MSDFDYEFVEGLDSYAEACELEELAWASAESYVYFEWDSGAYCRSDYIAGCDFCELLLDHGDFVIIEDRVVSPF